MDKLLSTREAAEVLSIKPNTLEIWRVQGKGPKFLKIGRSVKYRMERLKEYLNQHEVSSTSEYV